MSNYLLTTKTLSGLTAQALLKKSDKKLSTLYYATNKQSTLLSKATQLLKEGNMVFVAGCVFSNSHEKKLKNLLTSYPETFLVLVIDDNTMAVMEDLEGKGILSSELNLECNKDFLFRPLTVCRKYLRQNHKRINANMNELCNACEDILTWNTQNLTQLHKHFAFYCNVNTTEDTLAMMLNPNWKDIITEYYEQNDSKLTDLIEKMDKAGAIRYGSKSVSLIEGIVTDSFTNFMIVVILDYALNGKNVLCFDKDFSYGIEFYAGCGQPALNKVYAKLTRIFTSAVVTAFTLDREECIDAFYNPDFFL